jgi:hypothetical protein
MLRRVVSMRSVAAARFMTWFLEKSLASRIKDLAASESALSEILYLSLLLSFDSQLDMLIVSGLFSRIFNLIKEFIHE